MTIAAGDKIPDVKLMTMTRTGPKPVQSGELLGTGKVVLFGVPGAFTPTALGLELDARGFGLGARSQRYAMVIEDGTVADVMVENGVGVEVSSADAVLARL